mgnify:CR=1 FL=1|tara:strand:+ start:419 stop:829 length:411 start_codon:yes stop_codon:yes gene_type:complete
MRNVRYIKIVAVYLLIVFSSQTFSADQEILLNKYIQEGASSFSAERGKKLWFSVNKGKAPFNERSCTSCHTQDLKKTGKHIRTNKPIDPMAPSINPNSLSNSKNVEKWFKRNCKWTLGRECSVQEKGDIITYIQGH